MKEWNQQVDFNWGERQGRNPSYLRDHTNEGQAALGSGAYLPLRRLCCSEGLVSLSKRTEAHPRQTFLLPDPQQPLPGGGGRSEEDSLTVTTYQASPGLVRTRSPNRARTPSSPLCHQAVQGRAPCFHVPGLSALIYHPGETAARLSCTSSAHCTALKSHLSHQM